MEGRSRDIYTEPPVDVDTVANLGPLTALAGVWESAGGDDVHPAVLGDEHDAYVEHYELQPIDAQTNGPQLFYGLRYHTHITKPAEVETFHDQVGYWLWEPATGSVLHTIAIPRGQVVLALGRADADATEFTVRAERGSAIAGISSNPFLDEAFRTVAFRLTVTVNPDGTWSYDEDTTMLVADRPGLVHHTDRNTLRRVDAPTPNPLAAGSSLTSAPPR